MKPDSEDALPDPRPDHAPEAAPAAPPAAPPAVDAAPAQAPQPLVPDPSATMRIVVPDPGATITSMPHDAAWASEAEAFAEAVRNAEYGPDGDWRGHVEPGASTDLFERVWDEQAGAWLEQRPELYSDPSLVQADADDLLTKSLSSGPSFAFPSELVADETPVPQERSEPVAGPAVSAAQSPRQAQLAFLAFLLVAASMFAVGWLL